MMRATNNKTTNFKQSNKNKMKTTIEQALLKTLNEMPTNFSGRLFKKHGTLNGIQEQYFINCSHHRFLHKHCNKQFDASRSWTKKHIKPILQTTIFEPKKQQPYTDFPDFVKAGIDWLKQNGYKIMKPVTEFKEL